MKKRRARNNVSLSTSGASKAIGNPEKHKNGLSNQNNFWGEAELGVKITKLNADHVRGGRGHHDAVSASLLCSAAGPPFISVQPLLRGCVSGKSIHRQALR